MVNIQTSEIQKENQRMELRSLVKLASEPISHIWPMDTFIAHNPLHGLEHLPFDDAIDEAKRVRGGEGYLPNQEYRRYFREGRISQDSLNEALRHRSRNELVTLGKRKISHLETLRTILINGTGYVAPDVASAVLRELCGDDEREEIRKHLRGLSESNQSKFSLSDQAVDGRKTLAKWDTLSHWCDATVGTTIQNQINQELIKWCAGFLDQGHAPWPMPFRDHTFYGGWKELAQKDLSGPLFGIPDWKIKLQRLPVRPEDALLESLRILRIPHDLWIDYFTLHLAQLPGWTGFIAWRSEQANHEWQSTYRIDLVKYLAVRLFYEKELVALACQEKLGIQGTYPSMLSYMKENPNGYGLLKEWRTGGLPQAIEENLDRSLLNNPPPATDELNRLAQHIGEQWKGIRLEQDIDQKALILLHLSRIFEVSIKEFLSGPGKATSAMLDWVEHFPESAHGPIWLRAFENSYLKDLVKQLSPNLPKLVQSDEVAEQPPESRPLAQALFCIDVRSECFRRHFEEVGGNETFGFAGFFGVPLSFQAFGKEHETDQCPVLLKPNHVIKEIPRVYQGRDAEKFLKRQQLAKTGHALLHDLKENVITPYVMVESIGWFFGFRLFGQTLMPLWFKRFTSWVKNRFIVPIGTTLTVEKVTHREAEEMVASEHRAMIYRTLIEQYGRRGNAVSHDQVEQLRKQALNLAPIDGDADEKLHRLLHWTQEDHGQFLEDLRKDKDVGDQSVKQRMRRITQTGFTVTEQALFVETALRTLGFTKTFARLVLICSHGSTSDNNPFESALDCGACGGNEGFSNARAFAMMANSPQVRPLLAQKGIHIPADTHFLAGQHNTTTDEVELFDLEDVPPTHGKDVHRLRHDLQEAGRRNSQERVARFPGEGNDLPLDKASKRTEVRSADWSQVLPEWGLSRHSAFIVGRRLLTQRINLEGRTFLHSYDYLQDPTGKYLEIIMTAPMIVGNWINMGYYFSTVDQAVYGSGSKVYHNVVGRFGAMYGSQSDLCIGFPTQSVFNGEKPYHEPMRLFVIIEAPLERISGLISRHVILQRLFGNQWINLVALDPVTMEFFSHHSEKEWQLIQ